jgi:hypothetical protein
MANIIVNDVLQSAWAQRFFKYLRNAPQARQALERLESEGCNRRTLLWWLHSYITSPQHVERRRQAARRAPKEITSCLKHLQKTSERLSTLSLPHLGDLSKAEVTTHAAAYEIHALVESLAKGQKPLSLIRDEYARLGSARGAGRDEYHFITFCLSIQGLTGKKHYGEIAYLLEAAAEANRRKLPADPDLVRKIVTRFRQQYPRVYKSVEEFYTSPEWAKRPAFKPKVLSRKKRRRRPGFVPVEHINHSKLHL